MPTQPKPEHYQTFRDWLAATQRATGIKKADLAEIAGVRPQAVTKWFRGGRIKPQSLDRIATWAGVPYESLRDLVEGRPVSGSRRPPALLSPVAMRIARKLELIADEETVIELIEGIVDSTIAKRTGRHRAIGGR